MDFAAWSPSLSEQDKIIIYARYNPGRGREMRG